MNRRKSKAGFTLVELIVVIAILGILTGIAVPVYSGYITKAHKAADLELLGAVNVSFASACAEVGLGSADVTGASLVLTDKCITGVRVSGLSREALLSARAEESGVVMASLSARPVLIDSASATARIAEAFLQYFGANVGTELSYFDGAGNFAFENGVFVAYDNGEERPIVYSFTDADGNVHTGTLKVTTEELNEYLGSTFDQMGSTALAQKMDEVTQGAATVFVYDPNVGASFSQQEDVKNFLSSLGYDWDTMSATEKANALVLYTASLADSLDINACMEALERGDPLPVNYSYTGADGETYTNTYADLLLGTTAEYAMMMAYANDPNAKLTTTVTEAEQSTTLTAAGANATDPTVVGLFTSFSNGEITEDVLESQLTAHIKEVYGEGAEVTSVNTRKRGVTFTVPGSTTTTSVSASEWLSQYDLADYVGIAQAYTQFTQADEYSDYVANQAASDLSAYKAALNMVNDNVSSGDSADIISSVMSGGWEKGGIAEMLASITGN